MADSDLVAAYRLNAVEMARDLATLDNRIALLEMAQAWLRLAEIAEKFGEALLIARQQPHREADPDRLNGR